MLLRTSKNVICCLHQVFSSCTNADNLDWGAVTPDWFACSGSSASPRSWLLKSWLHGRYMSANFNCPLCTSMASDLLAIEDMNAVKAWRCFQIRPTFQNRFNLMLLAQWARTGRRQSSNKWSYEVRDSLGLGLAESALDLKVGKALGGPLHWKQCWL